MSICIKHNLLDDLRVNDIINESIILKRYLEEGYHHFDNFTDLLKDIYFMLYKHVINTTITTSTSFNYEIIHELLNLNQTAKIRLRTVGSLSNTYLSLKLVLDGLFESLRGKEILEELKELIYEYNSQSLLEFDSLLSDSELILLDKFISNQTLHEQLNHLDIIKKISELINGESDDSLLDNLIKRSLQTLSKEDSLDNLLEEMNKQLDEDQTQQTDDGHFEDAKLHKEIEKRFSPYLNKQYITQGENFKKGEFQTDIPDKSPDDRIHYSNTPIDKNDSLLHTEAYEITTQTDQEGNHHTPIDLHHNRTLHEQTYKKKIKQLFEEMKLSQIIHKAISETDKFNETTKTLGIKKHSMDLLSFDEIIEIYRRYKKPEFIKFINKVGKNRTYARQMQHKKRKKHAIPIDKVTSSHNIDLLIDEEYIALSLDIEAFENDFYDRYLKDGLLTIDLINQLDKRKGPIILCYDGSGSMEGIKIEETQSHILAIMEVAKIQKRRMVIIQFASASEPLYIKEINPKNIIAKDVLDIIDTFICGGTDFEKPLSKAIEYIKIDKHKKSDILFITDGQCEIRDAFKEYFLSIKQERDFKLYTMIMHSYTYHDYGDIADISDEILEIQNRDFSNWNETTNEKLYSLI